MSALGAKVDFARGRRPLFEPEEGKVEPRRSLRPFVPGMDGFPHRSERWSVGPARASIANARSRFGQEGIFDPSLQCYEDSDATHTVAACARSLGRREVFVDDLGFRHRRHKDDISGTTLVPVVLETNARLAAKHGYKRFRRSFGLFTHDLPWSLFCWLPEDIKARLRHVRVAAKRMGGDPPAPELPAELLDDPWLLRLGGPSRGLAFARPRAPSGMDSMPRQRRGAAGADSLSRTRASRGEWIVCAAKSRATSSMASYESAFFAIWRCNSSNWCWST